jgi:hypothetical protein
MNADEFIEQFIQQFIGQYGTMLLEEYDPN